MPSEEYKIQVAVAVHLQAYYPTVPIAVSPAAGFKISMGLAIKMLRMGYQKGTADMIILEACSGYHGLVIELKTLTGKVSEEQKSYLKRARDRGYFTALCRSAKEAISLIDWYLDSPF